jgi:hypothetical protein
MYYEDQNLGNAAENAAKKAILGALKNNPDITNENLSSIAQSAFDSVLSGYAVTVGVFPDCIYVCINTANNGGYTVVLNRMHFAV